MNAPLKILYQDNHLLAVDKPPDLLTQPSGTDQISIEEIAKEWIKHTYHKPGNVYLHVIHRLDKVASGIVLFARTSKALSRLQKLSRERKFDKRYIATVSPPPKDPQGTLEHFLFHSEYRAEIVDQHHPNAKLCLLSYKTISQTHSHALLEIKLHTGRYHQIRAQLSAIGSPIVGDHKYGSTLSHDKGIALRHDQLIFPHPITGNIITLLAH